MMTIRSVSQGLRRNPLAKRSLVLSGLVLLPVVLAVSFTGALTDANNHLNRIHAAIVNDDQIATVQGQQVPLGRELAAGLMGDHSKDNISWTLANAATARAGLANGRFATVLIIPPNFSANATSLAGAVTGNPYAARQATLTVENSSAGGVADPLVGSLITEYALNSMNQLVSTRFETNLFLQFTTLHDKLGQAAAGADQLAAGAGQLAGGLGQASNGADALAGGLGQLANGADRVNAGAQQLSGGAGRLAAGLDQLDSAVAPLGPGVQALYTGSQQLANGNQQLANGLDQLSSAFNNAVNPLDIPLLLTDLATAQQQIDQLSGAVGTAISSAERACLAGQVTGPSQVCSSIAAVASLLNTFTTTDINSAVGTATATLKGVQQFQGGLNAADAGSHRLAAGAAQLAGGLGQLNAKIPALIAGIARLDAGGHQLATGAAQLAAGTGQLATGAEQASSGANSLAGGLVKLHSGADQLQAGNRKLASGLHQAVKQIPAFTPPEASHLASVLSQAVALPPRSSLHLSKDLGAAYFVAFAIAVAGLVSFLVLRAVPQRVLTTGKNSLQQALMAYRPSVILSIAQSVLLSAAVGLVIGLGAGQAFRLVLVAIVAGLTFGAVNQALVALWGGRGRFFAMIVLVLAMPASLISTTPPLLSLLIKLSPIGPTLTVLRAILTHGRGLIPGLLELALWFAFGMALTVVAIARKRTVRADEVDLLPGVAPPPKSWLPAGLGWTWGPAGT